MKRNANERNRIASTLCACLKQHSVADLTYAPYGRLYELPSIQGPARYLPAPTNRTPTWGPSQVDVTATAALQPGTSWVAEFQPYQRRRNRATHTHAHTCTHTHTHARTRTHKLTHTHTLKKKFRFSAGAVGKSAARRCTNGLRACGVPNGPFVQISEREHLPQHGEYIVATR